jgi:quercetin dioxygenase-like cupin family protein
MSDLKIAGFEAGLAAEGYVVSSSTLSHDADNSVHSHDMDISAMVTEGDIRITCEGETRHCRPGDTITMAAGCEHSEDVGPDGVTFIVGRRAP